MAGTGKKGRGFEMAFCRRQKRVEEQQSAKKEATVGSSSALRRNQDEEGCARCCCLSLREEGAKRKRWPIDFLPLHVTQSVLFAFALMSQGVRVTPDTDLHFQDSKQSRKRLAAAPPSCRATTTAPPFDPKCHPGAAQVPSCRQVQSCHHKCNCATKCHCAASARRRH